MFAVGSLVAGSGCVDADPAIDESEIGQEVALGAPGSFNELGMAMASGDLNGDGIDDLAVSVPFEGAGAVFLYKGTSGGLTPWRRINETQVFPTVAHAGDQWGAQLAIADVDGDGHNDLVIGAPRGRDNDITHSGNPGGVVDVLWGAANGPVVSGAVRLDQEGLVPGEGDEKEDQFGISLAVRESSNAATWIAIGSPGEVYHGVATGFVHVVAFNGRTPSLVDTIPAPASVPSGGQFGAALVIRDFDNDGHRDVAVGAPGSGVSGATVKGHVYVFRGNGSSFGTGVEIVEASKLPISKGDEYGMAIAAGHFDSTKYPGHTGANDPLAEELLIAAPGFDGGHGRVFTADPTFNGSGAWTGMQIQLGFTGEAGGFGGGDLQPFNLSSSKALVVANLDSDGFDDFVTSSPFATVNGHESAGELVVFTTLNPGNQLAEKSHFTWTSGIGTDGVVQTPSNEDFFGTTLAVGNFHSTDKLALDIVGGMPLRAEVGLADGDNGIDAGALFTFTRTVPAPNVGWLQTKWYDEGTP